MFAIGKSAQIAKEMQSYNLDILGISECRWAESGKLKLTSGESVIYSVGEDGMHRSGVAIMMSKHAEASLMEWQPISDRIIMVRFYSKYIKLTIIHTYVPTLDAEYEHKELFYGQLQSTVENVNKHDLLLITGDMNAKVGSSNHNRERVMGKHGTGILNTNGERFIDFCEMNNLVITGTIFLHKDIHKNTWTSPDGKTHNQIDDILVNQQFRRSILDTRVRRGEDVASDHHLVQTRARLKLKKIIKPTSSRIRYDIDKLRHEAVRKEFTLELRNRFAILIWKQQKMMIMISIASGPNSAKPITIQQRMYWVGKGRVANHGSVLSHGRRLRRAA